MSMLSRLYRHIRFFGGPYQCLVCKKPVRKYFPFSTELELLARSNGFRYDFKRMETLNYEQCNCPFCLSSDRERLYLIFLEEYVNKNGNRASVIDFAPTPAFSQRVRKMFHIYKSTDLVRDDVDFKMDICDMKQIADNSFDIIICSHVLEHVPDPDKAMREIYRIMRPDGRAIIMVPLFWDVSETVEDKNHTTDHLRLKHYGQADHVRLFSRQNFLSRLNHAGFEVDDLKTSHFDSIKIMKNAISDNSRLYVCSKKANQVI